MPIIIIIIIIKRHRHNILAYKLETHIKLRPWIHCPFSSRSSSFLNDDYNQRIVSTLVTSYIFRNVTNYRSKLLFTK